MDLDWYWNLEHNHNFTVFLRTSCYLQLIRIAAWLPVHLFLLPMRATACRLVIINPLVWLIKSNNLDQSCHLFFSYFSRNCYQSCLSMLCALSPQWRWKSHFHLFSHLLLDLPDKQSKSSSLCSLENRSDFWRACSSLKYVLQFSSLYFIT